MIAAIRAPLMLYLFSGDESLSIPASFSYSGRTTRMTPIDYVFLYDFWHSVEKEKASKSLI
jgi:hypothetical protein